MSQAPPSLSVALLGDRVSGQVRLAVPTRARATVLVAVAATAAAYALGATAGTATAAAVAFAIGFLTLLTALVAGRHLFNPPASFDIHPTRFVLAGEDLPRAAIRDARVDHDEPGRGGSITLVVERLDGVRHTWAIDGRAHSPPDVQWLADRIVLDGGP